MPTGHLFSKGNFSVFNSSKNKLENSNFFPSLVGQKLYVRFLEELKTSKFSSEII
jgi:hypothetical protein